MSVMCAARKEKRCKNLLQKKKLKLVENFTLCTLAFLTAVLQEYRREGKSKIFEALKKNKFYHHEIQIFISHFYERSIIFLRFFDIIPRYFARWDEMAINFRSEETIDYHKSHCCHKNKNKARTTILFLCLKLYLVGRKN